MVASERRPPVLGMVEPEVRVRGARLWLLRGSWLAIVALALGIFLVAVPLRLEQLLTITPTGDDALVLLAPSEAAWLAQQGISVTAYALYFIAVETIFAAIYAVLGIVIFLRRSDERLAWFVSIALISFGVLVPGTARVLDTPGSAWQFPLHLIQNIGWLTFATTFFLFPDGHFVPRVTRWLPIVYFAWAVAWVVFPPANPFNWSLALALLAFLGLFGIGVLAQLYRYVFVSTMQQRLQTKWVVFAFGIATAGIVAFVAPLILFPASREPGGARVIYHVVGIAIFSSSLLMIPFSLDIAIRRYRLWEIDPIINRALVYSVLTVALVLIYFVSVIALQQALRALTGTPSQLAIVGSTLAIAALFYPLRDRIQQAIDRRFYRRKYDAQKVLAQFAETVRDEADLEKLSDELMRVVNETVQPKSAGLWLKDGEREVKG